MKLPRRRQFLHLAAGAAALGLLSLGILNHEAQSQTARTLKIVVPFASGGGGSVLARMLAEQIERQQMVTIIVENRPGAATALGTEAVARSTPDGNTLLITNTAFITNAHLRKLNYDPLTSFEPICALASVPIFVAVNSASPYRTVADFVSAARARPGELTMATFVGTTSHIGLEMLKRMANVDITLVPFPGSSPAVTALLGGHVTALYDNYASIAEHVNAGKLRVLGTAASVRVEALPEVPTIAEAGYNGYAIEGWWAAFAPAKTPKQTVTQIGGWFDAASRVPEVKVKLEPLGFYPMNTCGPDFAELLRKTYNDLGRAIREANIKAD